MRLVISLTILSVMTDSSISQTTREPSRDILQETTIKSYREDKSTVSQDGNPNLKDLWVYKPLPQDSHVASADGTEKDSRIVEVKAPHSVTKLAKTMGLTYGFDPYFSKGYFEPFERRPKLVTLVAFRKNGLIPRKTVKGTEDKLSEVAELQSPFNGISNFWMDTPAENHI